MGRSLLNYLGRSREGQERYIEALKEMKSKFVSIEDGMKVLTFGYKGIIDEVSGKVSDCESLRTIQ